MEDLKKQTQGKLFLCFSWIKNEQHYKHVTEQEYNPVVKDSV